MKKLLSFVLALTLVLSMAACGGSASSSAAAPAAASGSAAASTAAPSGGASKAASEASGDPMKVALIISGPVNDKGWCAEAYLGLTMIEEELGAEITFSENVSAADFEEVYRGYGDLGYDMIIGHGFEFGDVAKVVAPDYPDSFFAVTSSDVYQEPNVCGILNRNDQQGFLAGAVAAQETESGIVGCVGGGEIPSITAYVEGFKLGAAYINPEVKVLANYTGDFNDAAAAKQMAEAMINEGADIVTHDANAAGLGVFEAASEAGDVYAIGAIDDQYEVAPDCIITSAMSKLSSGILMAAQYLQEGKLEAKGYQFGVEEGTVKLADFRDYEISEEDEAMLMGIQDKIASGEITVDLQGVA